MGMYTGLRVKVTVKPEFRPMIGKISEGAMWEEFVDQFPFLTDYAQLDRSEFIPHGALCYMPSSWEIGEFPHQVATDGFDGTMDMQTGRWAFQCSLKNYDSEIYQFFRDVLSKIIESSEHIEYHYEEWDGSIMYNYTDGELVKIQETKGIYE
jgi:hypothetical protein